MIHDNGTLEIFSVYENPIDWPTPCFVVRRWFVRPDGTVEADPWAVAAKTLDDARGLVPVGLYRMDRGDTDDPCIVESWL